MLVMSQRNAPPLNSAVSCDDEMSMRKFFMGLSLVALGLALCSALGLVLIALLDRNCEVSFDESPMGARRCPSGLIIMD
jgi:hypothetical protein